MANLSDLTRKEQVLEVLKARLGEWVDGTELANEAVGGSEGLKRLRELKADGWLIQKREHPAPGKDIYQYRLVSVMRKDAPVEKVAPTKDVTVFMGHDAPKPIQPAQPPRGKKEEPWGIWKPTNAVIQEESCEWWVHKTRIRTRIAADFGGERWFWGVVIPGYHPRTSSDISRPEKRFHGTEPDRRAAKAAAEAKISELREMGREAWYA